MLKIIIKLFLSYVTQLIVLITKKYLYDTVTYTLIYFSAFHVSINIGFLIYSRCISLRDASRLRLSALFKRSSRGGTPSFRDTRFIYISLFPSPLLLLATSYKWDPVIVKRTYVRHTRTDTMENRVPVFPYANIQRHTALRWTLRCFLNFAISFAFPCVPQPPSILSQNVLCSFHRYKHPNHSLKRLLPPLTQKKKKKKRRRRKKKRNGRNK